MVVWKCLPILYFSITLPTALPISPAPARVPRVTRSATPASSLSVAASSSRAFAGTFGRQRGVAAGDQPFPGVVGVADLGQVLGVEQAHLQRPVGARRVWRSRVRAAR